MISHDLFVQMEYLISPEITSYQPPPTQLYCYELDFDSLLLSSEKQKRRRVALCYNFWQRLPPIKDKENIST